MTRTKEPADLGLGNHIRWTSKHQLVLQTLSKNERKISISGENLPLAALVAASTTLTHCEATKNKTVLKNVDDSVTFLAEKLAQGPIYGISTGFGGSADTRTAQFVNLQKALLQHHHVGVLLSSDIGRAKDDSSLHALKSHSLPRAVVRGAMLARANSLMRGHSAVRREVIENILKLLNLDFIPIVPLRGSISASGDLTPLSYIAGALEGNPGIYVDCRMEHGPRTIHNANEALALARIEPVTLGPKEGLGIMNGTTVSCAAAGLALHETQFLALMTQALTGMCTEALRGSAENYHAFIAASRPHPGQIEAAANITRYLQNSRLADIHNSGTRTGGLYQDRYALRTAAQWIAPCLEDLNLAAKQLEVELNSTTDNPLIDVQDQRIHHGGNFQAASVTLSTEKTRSCLQMFGKLIFAQHSELVNPMLNGSLPPNLSFDDPSLSYTFKGVEITMASYMSELGFLANPVSSHVQSAEMHNQAVNSLALISARYTADSVEVVSLMCAAHLYALCQALDLQALREVYLDDVRAKLKAITTGVASLPAGNKDLLMHDRVRDEVMLAIENGLMKGKNEDLQQRAKSAAEASIITLIDAQCAPRNNGESKVEQALNVDDNDLPGFLSTFRTTVPQIIIEAITSAQKLFWRSGPISETEQVLSKGSKTIYRYVREELGVPLHKGLVEHATFDEAEAFMPSDGREVIGRQIGKIYEAIRSGAIHSAIVESLTQAEDAAGNESQQDAGVNDV